MQHTLLPLAFLTLFPAGPAAQTPAPDLARFWWSDYDGNGASDAFVAHADGSVALLANHGDGTFEDVTQRAGLSGLRGVHQALWQDVDGDGVTELYLVVPGGESVLLRQSGGTFARATRAAGLPLDTRVLQGEWLDVDGDALPDLHLSTARGELVFRNLGDGTFAENDLGLELPAVEWSEDLRAWTEHPERVPDLPLEGPVVGAGGSGSSQAATGQGGVGGAAGRGSAAAAAFCFDSMKDQATLNCLTASSTPTLGTLYPLGVEFNIDGSGRVGIGTLAPGESLDVVGSIRTSGQLISSAASGAPLVVSSSTKVTNLNADRLDGLDASAFSQFGALVDTAELADDAVTSAKIALGAVATADLAPNAVTSAKIAAGAVGNSDLADDAVTSAKIAPGEVGASDLAVDSVSSTKIVDGDVQMNDLAVASVGPVQLAIGAVSDLSVNVDAAIQGTKIVPDFGDQDVSSTGRASFQGPLNASAVVGLGLNGPTNGHLGVSGTPNFDGVPSIQWFGDEIGVAGISTGPGAFDNFGVVGHSDGVGVRGESALNGNTGDLGTPLYGVEGASANVGVHGRNLMGSSLAWGQLGTPEYGVRGQGPNGGGYFYGDLFEGVKALTDSSIGYAVSGFANSSTGLAVGLRAQSNSDQGRGVWAYAASPTGTTYGVYSYNSSTSGRAVYANSAPLTGQTYAFYGENSSTSGMGCYAVADAPTGITYGVLGAASSTSGTGVRGEGTSLSGVNFGVQGRTYSPSGWGVLSFGSSGTTGQKNFIQPHPSDPSKEIRFTSLEGNESGTYFRGSGKLSNGLAVIEVPEEFRLVSEAEGLTVSVTALGPNAGLWVESRDLERVIVRGTNDVAFDYMVNGVRRGWAEYQAVHANHGFVPEERGVPFGTQYPPAFRALLVENGILNADFTPNEATAAALGWELIEPRAEVRAREGRQRAQEQAEHEALRVERAAALEQD